MINIQGRLNPRQLRELREAINNLDLPKPKQKKLLIRIAKYGLIPKAQRNAKQQKDPFGNAWAPRKRQKRRKSLPKITKLLKIKAENDQVRIYAHGGQYKSGNSAISAGIIAGMHQGGMSINRKKSTVKQENKRSLTEMKTEPANKKQAKKLRLLGYKIKVGKREKIPTSKWITENLTFATAGRIIKRLDNKQYRESWEIKVPARIFLGINDQEFTEIIQRQLQNLNHGS